MGAVTTNWSGNHTYAARRVLRPGSVAELQAVVAAADRVRALGSRHTFTALPDTDGDLVELDALPTVVEVDSASRTVSVSAGVRYGELSARLQRAAGPCATMASLPHISVAGAVATGRTGPATARSPSRPRCGRWTWSDRTGRCARSVAGRPASTAAWWRSAPWAW